MILLNSEKQKERKMKPSDVVPAKFKKKGFCLLKRWCGNE
jgi:hypothetical protein